jgi:hypothetical protein
MPGVELRRYIVIGRSVQRHNGQVLACSVEIVAAEYQDVTADQCSPTNKSHLQGRVSQVSIQIAHGVVPLLQELGLYQMGDV